jgi:predicted nucleotidyltransferase
MPDRPRTRTLTLRGIRAATLDRFRARARANHRSLNAELLLLLEQAAASRPPLNAVREVAVVPYAGAARTAQSVLDQVDAKALADVCRRRHISWLAIFGSQAMGTARPDSDVDVVVDFEPGMTPGFEIIRVAEELEGLFGGRRVDLVTRRGLAQPLRDHVLSSARTLYGA